jgi:PilZ domain-containing protein
MEKRIPIAIVVHLVRPEDDTTERPELTFTDNISAHGACVVSSRRWKPGEIAEVTSLNDKIMLVGKVTHCQKRGDDRYNVGLNFSDNEVTWNPYIRHVGPQVGESRDCASPRLAQSA